jgi:hypothetical protein
MIKVDIQGEHYVVTLPKMTLVLTRDEFMTALRRGKWWKRRRVLTDREAEMATRMAEKLTRLAQIQRSSPGEGGGPGG